jgi:hypothetical protein
MNVKGVHGWPGHICTSYFNPILHTAWLDNHTLTLQVYSTEK